jgi:hypothetical protein
MNSHRPGDSNLIWQRGDMRPGRRRFCDKAGITRLSQRNQHHRTLRGPTYNDQQDAAGLKQTNQTQVAGTQLAKISSQSPSQRQLSP